MKMRMTLSECASFLRGNDNYLVITHKRPDGDAVGCGGGLVRLLRRLNKTAYLFENPEITEKYMPFAEGLFAPEGYEYKTVVTVDCASVSQFCVGAESFAEKTDLSIDHHMSNTDYGKNLFLEDRAACGEVIAELYEELNITPDVDEANALYVAVSTDTGCFAYGNTTAHTHAVAARLASCGAELQKLNKILFKTKTRSRVTLDGYLYSSMGYFCDGRVAVCKISLEDRKKFNINEDDLDSIASLPVEIEGVVVGITIKETDFGSKISIRTDGRANASNICAVFGGGGHLQAAGCSMSCDMDEAERRLVEEVKKALC